MTEREFGRFFACLVEKATGQPMDPACDFDWKGWFDSDLPAPAQRWCASLAADSYLRESGGFSFMAVECLSGTTE